MPLYTQGELVKEMKEKGIGRPSTYSIIISRLLERKYVIEKKSRLIPTKLGIEVYNFLKQSKELSYLVSEEFTRELEHKMDIISEKEGEDYKEVLKTTITIILN